MNSSRPSWSSSATRSATSSRGTSVASKKLIVGPGQGRVTVEQRRIPGQANGLLKFRWHDADSMEGARSRNQRNLRRSFTSYVPETIQKPLLAPGARGVI